MMVADVTYSNYVNQLLTKKSGAKRLHNRYLSNSQPIESMHKSTHCRYIP